MKSLIAVTFVLVLAGCARNDFDKFQSEYMTGCEGNGSTEYVCGCSFEKLEKHFGREKIEHWERTGNPPVEALEFAAQASAECRQ